jgi:hypothetical protein
MAITELKPGKPPDVADIAILTVHLERGAELSGLKGKRSSRSKHVNVHAKSGSLADAESRTDSRAPFVERAMRQQSRDTCRVSKSQVDVKGTRKGVSAIECRRATANYLYAIDRSHGYRR